MDLVSRGREIQRPLTYDSVALREQRRTQSSEGRQERADSPSESARVYGARIRELMRTKHDISAQSLPGIGYRARDDATAEAEISSLAAVYRIVLNAKQRGRLPDKSGPDEAKGLSND